jgi:1-acyl-sn-glycerol-3-phosphate acyltransferase
VLYWVIKAILTPILRLFYRVRIEGRDGLPSRGAVILAANHRSFMDSLFLPLVIRRRVTFVAKAEYFDDKKTAWFFRGVGQRWRPPPRCWKRGACSGSIPKGLAPATATSTAVTPAWPASGCGRARRSSPWG